MEWMQSWATVIVAFIGIGGIVFQQRNTNKREVLVPGIRSQDDLKARLHDTRREVYADYLSEARSFAWFVQREDGTDELLKQRDDRLERLSQSEARLYIVASAATRTACDRLTEHLWVVPGPAVEVWMNTRQLVELALLEAMHVDLGISKDLVGT
jgi:hypothetical protein